jgi:hypothetical protein
LLYTSSNTACPPPASSKLAPVVPSLPSHQPGSVYSIESFQVLPSHLLYVFTPGSCSPTPLPVHYNNRPLIHIPPINSHIIKTRYLARPLN